MLIAKRHLFFIKERQSWFLEEIQKLTFLIKSVKVKKSDLVSDRRKKKRKPGFCWRNFVEFSAAKIFHFETTRRFNRHTTDRLLRYKLKIEKISYLKSHRFQPQIHRFLESCYPQLPCPGPARPSCNNFLVLWTIF